VRSAIGVVVAREMRAVVKNTRWQDIIFRPLGPLIRAKEHQKGEYVDFEKLNHGSVSVKTRNRCISWTLISVNQRVWS
jgi:hypothetical protein